MNESWLDSFFEFVVTHPVANAMLFAAAIVFGWVSYSNLQIELMPDISYPTITVRTEYDGAAPQEVESQVSQPIEEALATLDGLVNIESRSRAGRSDVILGFDWGTDMTAASQSIRENLQVTFLPDGAGRPLILRYDPSLDPFIRLTLAYAPGTGPKDPDQALYHLREAADRVLKRDLEGMKGVAAVRVRGGLEREIRVNVHEDWMSARQVRLDQVRLALATQNVNVAGGSILEGEVEFLVRTLNEYASVQELADLRVRRDDGLSIPLSEVATFEETHKDRTVVAHMNGAEAVELELFKEADANVVDVARRVKARLAGDGAMDEGLEGELSEGMTVTLLDDQAAFVEAAIDNLIEASWQGGILAIAVTFLFLADFRTTFLTSLAIPLSVVMAFGPMYLRGASLNLMSLGGLALGVGIVIDNTTVVLESIQVLRDEGMARVESAIKGTSIIAMPVIASTMTTICVFLPIAFIDGIAGELFSDLSLTVVASVAASLIVALILVPMLVALDPQGIAAPTTGLLGAISRQESFSEILRTAWRSIVDPPLEQWRVSRAYITERWWRRVLWPWTVFRFLVQFGARIVGVPTLLVAGGTLALGWRFTSWALAWLAWPPVVGARVFMRWYDRQALHYDRLLRWSLRRPLFVIGTISAMFVLSLWGGTRLGSSLFPEMYQGKFTVEASLPIGTPLPETVIQLGRAEALLRDHPDVAQVYSTIGADPRADAGADEGEHTGRLRVELKPSDEEPEIRESRVMEELRAMLAPIPRLKIRMERPEIFSFATPVEVVVHGYDLGTLRTAGDSVAAAIGSLEGISDVQSSLVRGYPEVQIRYDRDQLVRFGLDAATVAERVRDQVQGVDATTIRRADRRIDLRLQLDEADRSTLADLAHLNINPRLDPPIPLDAVAEIDQVEGPSEIRRVDQQRAVVVTANLDGFDLGSAAKAIDKRLRATPLPRDTSYEIAGQSEELQRSASSMWFAAALAVFLVYVVMASTFESLVQPLVILFSVPLAVIGIVAGLWLWDMPVSVGVFIGGIVLAGIVVNNAIVLLDAINRFREDGLPAEEAIAQANTLRLRPILITSVNTVFGLIPLALGYGTAAEIQQPMSIALMGGMTSSTVLTLLYVPCLMMLVYRITNDTGPRVRVEAAT